MYSIFEKLLKEHGVTAYKVSKATGVTTSTLTAWKKGDYTPKADKLQKIADYFGVTLPYLMGQTDIREDFENDPDYYVPAEYREMGMDAEAYYRFKKAESEDAQREQSSFSAQHDPYTEHEVKVLDAYRSKPEMQPAVDRLLGVEPEESEYIELVARGGKYKVKKEDVVKWAKQLDLEHNEEDHDLC